MLETHSDCFLVVKKNTPPPLSSLSQRKWRSPKKWTSKDQSGRLLHFDIGSKRQIARRWKHRPASLALRSSQCLWSGDLGLTNGLSFAKKWNGNYTSGVKKNISNSSKFKVECCWNCMEKHDSTKSSTFHVRGGQTFLHCAAGRLNCRILVRSWGF